MNGTAPLPCRESDPVLEWAARRIGPWFAPVWLPLLLLGPLIDASVAGEPLQVLSLLLVGAGYAVAVLLPFRIGVGAPWKNEIAFLCLLLLGTAYLVVWHADEVFIYPLLAIGAAVSVRQRWALGLISALTISGALGAGFTRGSLDAAMLLGFATFMAGVGTFLVLHLIGVVDERTKAQERLARTAVAQERLRISRDLHDLLGHTLSLIVVKSEAVRRLVVTDTDAAAAHAADIETVGRHALAEVREAVAGYRSVSLDEELDSARAALTAAGVRVRVEFSAPGLDARTDSLLGWIVREGTTNVLRHSRATRCTIRIERAGESVRAVVHDDGGAPREASGHTDLGNGLTGLQERVEEQGGVLTAVAVPGGFRLAATLPDHADVKAPA